MNYKYVKESDQEENGKHVGMFQDMNILNSSFLVFEAHIMSFQGYTMLR